MKRLAALLAAVLAAPAARAAWTGDLTRSVENGATVLAYHSSARDVEPTSASGLDFKWKSRGLVLEQRSAMTPVAQFSLRLMPFTGRQDLEGMGFNPHVAGGGAGVYLAPPEPFGPVRLGAAALWDGAGGARKRAGAGGSTRYDRVYWSELTLAAGASADPLPYLRVYGGLAHASFRMRTSVGGAKTNWKQDSPWGGFAGATLSAEEAWFLTAELRAGGERAMALSLGYQY